LLYQFSSLACLKGKELLAQPAQTMNRIHQSLQLLTCCASLLLVSGTVTAATIVGGWDGSTNAENTGLTFTGTGTTATASSTYIFGSGGTGTGINGTNGTTNITGTGGNAVDVTFRIDLTGTHAVDFDTFWVQMQRGGNTSSNVVSNPSYSLDNSTFIALGLTNIEEVAVGGNGGGNNVGPWDTLTAATDFRAPNGFGGSIGPQQVYRISGLGAAGTLSSGSLWVRYTVGASSNNSGNLTVINDRIDLDTAAIGLSSQNDVAGGTDGFDVIWTGDAVLIPEPSTALLSLLSSNFLPLSCVHVFQSSFHLRSWCDSSLCHTCSR